MPTEESKLEDMTLETKEKDTLQPATRTVPTLVGYTNPQKIKDKRVAQEMTEIQIVGSCLFLATTHPYILFPRDKLLLKCYIPPNSPWLLMQHFQISGDFHDFPHDLTMMLKDLLDDDFRSTTQDHEKFKPLQWQNLNKRRIIRKSQNIIPLTVKKDAPPWPSGTIALTTTILSPPSHGQMFMIGTDISRVGIDGTLVQDGRLLIHTEASPTLHTRFLKGILIATKFKIWLDTGPWHERGVCPEELQTILTPD
ncbi:hypothetical protein GW17_00055524 [Ensete ventricosum]|nr:hypothetical protein GW17_00055524 [Ensete ventricosum]